MRALHADPYGSGPNVLSRAAHEPLMSSALTIYSSVYRLKVYGYKWPLIRPRLRVETCKVTASRLIPALANRLAWPSCPRCSWAEGGLRAKTNLHLSTESCKSKVKLSFLPPMLMGRRGPKGHPYMKHRLICTVYLSIELSCTLAFLPPMLMGRRGPKGQHQSATLD